MFDQPNHLFDQRFGSADERKPKADDHVHKAGNATRDKITQVFERQAKLPARLKPTGALANPA